MLIYELVDICKSIMCDLKISVFIKKNNTELSDRIELALSLGLQSLQLDSKLRSKERIDKFKSELLTELYNQCTLSQRNFFMRIYPNYPNASQIDNAIRMCDETVAINRKGQVNVDTNTRGEN